MSFQPELNAEVVNEMRHIKPLDAITIKNCGEIFLDFFKLEKDELGESDLTNSSIYTMSLDDTSYVDLQMIKRFDTLYDVMLCDLQKIDGSYETRPKLQLYDDLYEFVHTNQLHEINRYVFGDGPIQSYWDPSTRSELKTVRIWRKQLKNKTEVPKILIDIYKTASASQEFCSSDVAMITGYDWSKDFDILDIFIDVESVVEPITYQQVYNSVLRNVYFRQWMFFDEIAGGKDMEYFDSIIEHPNVIAVFNWIFNLLIENPEAVDKFMCNPFPIDQNASCEINDMDGEKMIPSYIVQLRIFYRWMSKQLFMLFSGGYHDRISLLDDHIRRSISCFDKSSRIKYFEDTYIYMVNHFTKIVCEYNCPESILKTIQDTFANENFKNIIKFCVNEQVKYQFNLTYRDSSTDSNESTGSYSDSSQISIQKIE